MRWQNNTTYKWWVVGMLWFACFFNYADRQAIFAVFPLLRAELSLTPLQLGFAASAFMWMYALFGPFAGWICDRVSRRNVIVSALVFWSLVTAATAVCTGYRELLLCRALGGLGEAFYFPAAMSLLGDYHKLTRSRAMSIHQSAVYGGSIAGGFLSGYMGEHHGWRSSFILFGCGGLLIGLLLFALLREPSRGKADIGVSGTVDEHFSWFDGVAGVFRNPYALVMIFVFVCANFVAVVFLTWLPTLLHDRFHMNLSLAGLNSTVFLQTASVVGVLAGGWMADRMVRGPGGSGRSGRQFTQMIGLLCGVPFIFLQGWTHTTSIIIIAMCGFGLFKGLYDANIWAALYEVIPVSRRGTTVGLMNSIGWLGGGLAPIAIAAGSQRFSMGACISATAIIYLCGGLVLVLALRKSKTYSSPELYTDAKWM